LPITIPVKLEILPKTLNLILYELLLVLLKYRKWPESENIKQITGNTIFKWII